MDLFEVKQLYFYSMHSVYLFYVFYLAFGF